MTRRPITVDELATMAWEPVQVEATLRGYFLKVNRSTNPIRWRWTVYKLESTTRPYTRRRGFESASGYARSLERAKHAAETALTQLEDK
jgi:hypothetical protein